MFRYMLANTVPNMPKKLKINCNNNLFVIATPNTVNG